MSYYEQILRKAKPICPSPRRLSARTAAPSPPDPFAAASGAYTTPP